MTLFGSKIYVDKNIDEEAYSDFWTLFIISLSKNISFLETYFLHVYVCVCVCVCVYVSTLDTYNFYPITTKFGTQVGILNSNVQFEDGLCEFHRDF